MLAIIYSSQNLETRLTEKEDRFRIFTVVFTAVSECRMRNLAPVPASCLNDVLELKLVSGTSDMKHDLPRKPVPHRVLTRKMPAHSCCLDPEVNPPNLASIDNRSWCTRM